MQGLTQTFFFYVQMGLLLTHILIIEMVIITMERRV